MIQVGQKLYEYSKERYANKGEFTIQERTVTKVGRKLFEVDDNSRQKFSIDKLRYEDKNYTQFNRKLYLTKQEILDTIDCAKLYSQVMKELGQYNKPAHISYDQIKAIAEILEIKQNETIC
jgi:hypothetical protein